MALEGTLKDFSLADIFQLIGIQKKTGILTLKNEGDVVTVSFLNGSVVSADRYDSVRPRGFWRSDIGCSWRPSRISQDRSQRLSRGSMTRTDGPDPATVTHEPRRPPRGPIDPNGLLRRWEHRPG